jgi:hypothetical protein
MERKVVSLHMNSGDGLRFFMNGIIEFLSHRADLNPAPEITGMALSALLLIHLDHFHLVLLKPSMPTAVGSVLCIQLL